MKERPRIEPPKIKAINLTHEALWKSCSRIFVMVVGP